VAKPCRCYKSEYRDPECDAEFPIICHWWEYQPVQARLWRVLRTFGMGPLSEPITG